MRILFWSELFWPYIGGAEIFGARLLGALVSRGHEVAVITCHDTLELPDRDRFDGIPVTRLPFRGAMTRRDLSRLQEAQATAAQLLRDFAPDSIHLNGIGTSAALCLRAAAARGVPLVVTLQQEMLPSQAAPDSLFFHALRAASWVVACSSAALAQARGSLPEIASRSSRLFNCVDAPDVAPAPLPLDPPRILCLGRLVPAKGFDLALRAFAAIRERFAARLAFVGDGPLRADLEALAAALRISPAVEFRGWVAPEQVYREINAATMVLMPSRREGLPLSAVQAALLGRPIVATAVGGLPDVVEDGRTGYLVASDDGGALTEALVKALANRDRTREMGRRARLHALERFDWPRTVDGYEEVYRRVAGGGRPG